MIGLIGEPGEATRQDFVAALFESLLEAVELPTTPDEDSR